MTLGYQRAKSYLMSLFAKRGIDELEARLRPKQKDAPQHVPQRDAVTPEAVASRWDLLGATSEQRAQLYDAWTQDHAPAFAHNVEHLIGTVKVPVGLAGPLRVNGLFAQGDYYVPMATTEATLVASYSRGAGLITAAGGASAMLLSEGVTRAPMFAFDDLVAVGRFVDWVLQHLDDIEQVANATTQHGELVDLELCIEGTKVYLLFIYTTGEAAGQNMVTIATYAAVAWIREHSPIEPATAYLESNFSGDKKASMLSFQRVRGKKVVAEAILPAPLVREWLHVEPERMIEYGKVGTVGAMMSGALGTQGHYANGLAALFLACGQDVACVSEAAVGITDFELTEAGDLHACATLPNLIVGTVGGGTKLPSQAVCLELLGLPEQDRARAFAEIAAALCLAGELSLIAAIAAGEFAQAHALHARGKPLEPPRS